MPSLEGLCYLAGLVDGEGCIYIHRMHNIKGAKGLKHALRLQVGMTNAPVVYWLREAFGGSVQVQNRAAPRKPCYIWNVYGANAASLIEQLRPYLRVKQPEADIALQFAALGFSTGAPISDAVSELREQFCSQLRELKQISYEEAA